MNLYYTIVHQRAVNQCNRVASAISKCEDAMSSVSTQIDAIASSWQGNSGNAMAEKLQSLNTSISGIVSALSSIEGQMRTEAEAVNSTLERLAREKAEEEAMSKNE